MSLSLCPTAHYREEGGGVRKGVGWRRRRRRKKRRMRRVKLYRGLLNKSRNFTNLDRLIPKEFVSIQAITVL